MPEPSWIAASLAAGSGVAGGIAAWRSSRPAERLGLTLFVLGATAVALVGFDVVGEPARRWLFRSGVVTWLAGTLLAAWSRRSRGPS